MLNKNESMIPKYEIAGICCCHCCCLLLLLLQLLMVLVLTVTDPSRTICAEKIEANVFF